jgi:hypothetical protein
LPPQPVRQDSTARLHLPDQAGYGRALAIVALLPLGGATVALGQRPDVT